MKQKIKDLFFGLANVLMWLIILILLFYGK